MSSSHPQPQPTRLTDFALVDVTVAKMGAGGFGLVFMGPDRLHGNEWYALKTLRPELLALRPQLRDLFLGECLTWVGLWPHPNLLTALGATEIDGRLYLFLDYAEHGSLRDLLAFNQPFEWRFRWAQHIAAGLVALHTPDPEFLRPHPLLHRDLKPENILVDQRGYAMITDFGLAAAIGVELAQSPDAVQAFALVDALATQAAHGQTSQAAHASQATRTTHFHTRTTATASAAGVGGTPGMAGLGGVGTIAYMPPEQWEKGGAVGTPADLYAFGLILSELLAGRHGLIDLGSPLSQDGWYQLHLTGTPRPLQSGPADGATRLPSAVEELYQVLLAKRPEDRPTAAQALAVLQQAAAALGEDPYTPPDVYSRTDERRQIKWQGWANTCFRFGLYEQALARNQRALALAPRDFSALNTQGAIVARLELQAREAGRPEEGTRLLEEALGWYDQAIAAASTDQERAVAQVMKATTLSSFGRYADAEPVYAAALALAPEGGGYWSNRANNGQRWARAEAQAGRREEAIRLYALAEEYAQQAIQWQPNHPNNSRLLAIIQRERAQLGE